MKLGMGSVQPVFPAGAGLAALDKARLPGEVGRAKAPSRGGPVPSTVHLPELTVRKYSPAGHPGTSKTRAPHPSGSADHGSVSSRLLSGVARWKDCGRFLTSGGTGERILPPVAPGFSVPIRFPSGQRAFRTQHPSFACLLAWLVTGSTLGRPESARCQNGSAQLASGRRLRAHERKRRGPVPSVDKRGMGPATDSKGACKSHCMAMCYAKPPVIASSRFPSSD